MTDVFTGEGIQKKDEDFIDLAYGTSNQAVYSEKRLSNEIDLEVQSRMSERIETPLGDLTLDQLADIAKVPEEEVIEIRERINAFYRDNFGIDDYVGYAFEYLGLKKDDEGIIITETPQIATPNLADITSFVANRVLRSVYPEHNFQYEIIQMRADSAAGSLDVKIAAYQPEIFDSKDKPNVHRLFSPKRADERATIGDLTATYEGRMMTAIELGLLDADIFLDQKTGKLKPEFVDQNEIPLLDVHTLLRYHLYGENTPNKSDNYEFYARCMQDVVLSPQITNDEVLDSFVFIWKKNDRRQTKMTIRQLRDKMQLEGRSIEKDQDGFSYFDSDNGGYFIRPMSNTYYKTIPIYAGTFAIPSDKGAVRILAENLDGASDFQERTLETIDKLGRAFGKKPNFYLVVPYINETEKDKAKRIKSTAYIKEIMNNPARLQEIEEQALSEFNPEGSQLYDLYYIIYKIILDSLEK